MKYIKILLLLAIGSMSTLLSHSAFASGEDVIQPTVEGWINGQTGRWSIARPEMLGCRNRGGPNVWATYLGFQLPLNPSADIKLQLQIMDVRNHPQQFFLYAIPEMEWSAETLQGKDAPGWDPKMNDVAPEAILLAEVNNPIGSDSIVLGGTPEMAAFLKSNSSESVTFIVVASDGSTSFHSTEGNPEKGPKLVVTQ